MCLPTELDLSLAYRIAAKVGRHQGRTKVEKTRRAALNPAALLRFRIDATYLIRAMECSNGMR
jgi:hypothetical protein